MISYISFINTLSKCYELLSIITWSFTRKVNHQKPCTGRQILRNFSGMLMKTATVTWALMSLPRSSQNMGTAAPKKKSRWAGIKRIIRVSNQGWGRYRFGVCWFGTLEDILFSPLYPAEPTVSFFAIIIDRDEPISPGGCYIQKSSMAETMGCSQKVAIACQHTGVDVLLLTIYKYFCGERCKLLLFDIFYTTLMHPENR